MKLKNKLHGAVLVIAGLLLFSAGCDTGKQDGYTSLQYSLQGETALAGAISGSSSSVKLAIRELTSATVIAALNAAYTRGVEVKLVVDSDSSTVTGLDAAIGKEAGNEDGFMDSNFAIIDGTTALFLSSYDVSDTAFLAVTVKETQLVATLEDEFSKMYDLKAFGNGDGTSDKKLKTNYLTEFKAGGNCVEMYFVPQNYVFTDKSNYLFSRMDQVKREAVVAAAKVDNDGMYKRLRDFWDYGVSVSYRFGSDQNSVAIDDSYLSAQPAMSVAGSVYRFNLVFLDPGMSYQTMVFTSFPWDQGGTINNNDGVCLMISGPVVEKIFNDVKAATD